MVRKISLPTKLLQALPVPIRKRLPSTVAVFAVSKKESQRLNTAYRRKRSATNVLSFRYGSSYGEILLCLPIIKKEAREAKHSMKFQMTWMMLHGMLHISGLHHEGSAKAAAHTDRLEKNILRSLFSSQKKLSRKT